MLECHKGAQFLASKQSAEHATAPLQARAFDLMWGLTSRQSVMKVFVSGNCQTDQILAGLQAAHLPSVSVTGLRHGPQDWPGTAADREAALAADVLLTHYDPHHFTSWIPEERILRIPDLFFAGFHPDQTALALRDNPGKKLKLSLKVSENRRARLHISSALAAWSFKNNLSVEVATRLFRGEVFEALGYLDAFDTSYQAMREDFVDLGFDFEPMKKVLHTRSVFMWGVEHPKLALTFCLCESILARLGLDGSSLSALSSIIPDPLAPEYACGCYPPIAEHLGVEGSWAMRIDSVFHADIASYLNEFFWLLGHFPREHIRIMDRDAHRFDFEKMSGVLEHYL